MKKAAEKLLIERRLGLAQAAEHLLRGWNLIGDADAT